MTKLESIPGIGNRTAERLERQGHRRAEQVAAANSSQLQKIEGVGAKTTINAQKTLGVESDEDDQIDIGDFQYVCNHGCGYRAYAYGSISVHEQSKCPKNSDSTGLF